MDLFKVERELDGDLVVVASKELEELVDETIRLLRLATRTIMYVEPRVNAEPCDPPPVTTCNCQSVCNCQT